MPENKEAISFSLDKSKMQKMALNYSINDKLNKVFSNVNMKFNLDNFNHKLSFNNNDYTLSLACIMANRSGSGIYTYSSIIEVNNIELKNMYWNEFHGSVSYSEMLNKILLGFNHSSIYQQNNSKIQKSFNTTIVASLHDTKNDMYFNDPLINIVIS